jgi:hypothetical protein
MKPLAWPMKDIYVQQLDSAAMPELLCIQDTVCRQLQIPELYFPLTPAEMQELVGTDGVCLGLMCDVGLVGFLGLLFMGEREGNVGRDLGLPSHCLPQVAYINTINIAPPYQGQGLQRHLQRALLHILGAQVPASMQASGAALLQAAAVSAQPWQWLCSTVSPRNLPSLQAHFGSGFRIAGLRHPVRPAGAWLDRSSHDRWTSPKPDSLPAIAEKPLCLTTQ